MSDDRVEAWGGHRSSEVEALAGVGAEFGQLVVLCGCLDTLGNNGHPKAVGEFDDRGYDGVAGREE